MSHLEGCGATRKICKCADKATIADGIPLVILKPIYAHAEFADTLVWKTVIAEWNARHFAPAGSARDKDLKVPFRQVERNLPSLGAAARSIEDRALISCQRLHVERCRLASRVFCVELR